MIKWLYWNTIVPRLCFIPYFVARAILSVIATICWLSGSLRKRVASVHLCIEAGERGWESIEFKELYQSACEYLSPKSVHPLVVQADQSYLKQIAKLLQSEQITHYLYDPRTNNSNLLFWRGLWNSFCVGILLTQKGVIPIVLLTDLSVRTWRAQAAIVSARKGIVVCFMSPKCVGSIFPHRRLLGPSLMSFSVQTLKMLNGLIESREANTLPTALFTGSLYEPRASRLEKIRMGLAEQGLVLDIKGRAMGSERVSDAVYWARLCYADIVVTTADQSIQNGTDWAHIPHLIYRYIEVLASGALLVAQDVPSVQRYFIPGVHFVTFDSAEQAILVISHYLGNEAERLLIAKQGKERAENLIRAGSFWLQVDSSLGQDALI